MRQYALAGSLALLAAVLPSAQAQMVAPFLVPSYAPSGAQLTTSSKVDQIYGSIPTGPATSTAIQLSLDDAVSRGLDRNLALFTAQQNQRVEAGQTLSAFNALMPSLTAQAQTATQSVDLVAMGIKPSVVAPLLPPGVTLPAIIKVNNTAAQINLSQQIFNLPAIELYRAAKANIKVADLNTLNIRGNVVLLVSTAYLQTLAADAQWKNEQALLRSDEVELNQAKDRHEAGIATNLDELRARVQYQTQQQAVINAENTFAKDKIALCRMIGLAADQPIELTDAAPYADLAAKPLDEAKQIAYARRKDYLALLAQVRSAEYTNKAARYQRMPSLSIGGFYGVNGETHGLYHGVFTAAGTLKVPVFREAQFRGDREVTEAQLIRLRLQIADLQVAIESQLRSSMLGMCRRRRSL